MNVQCLIDMSGGVNKCAQRLGVSHPTICDWRRAGAIPPGRIIQIATEFGLPLEVVSLLSRQTPIKRAAA